MQSRVSTYHCLVFSLLLAAPIILEFTSLEWADWKRQGSPLGNGCTRTTMVREFITLWVVSQLVSFMLHLWSSKFSTLSYQHQVKVAKYWVQILWGSQKVSR